MPDRMAPAEYGGCWHVNPGEDACDGCQPCEHMNTRMEVDVLGPMTSPTPDAPPMAPVEGWSVVCVDCEATISVHGRRP
jgi:hypothetical protein